MKEYESLWKGDDAESGATGADTAAEAEAARVESVAAAEQAEQERAHIARQAVKKEEEEAAAATRAHEAAERNAAEQRAKQDAETAAAAAAEAEAEAVEAAEARAAEAANAEARAHAAEQAAAAAQAQQATEADVEEHQLNEPAAVEVLEVVVSTGEDEAVSASTADDSTEHVPSTESPAPVEPIPPTESVAVAAAPTPSTRAELEAKRDEARARRAKQRAEDAERKAQEEGPAQGSNLMRSRRSQSIRGKTGGVASIRARMSTASSSAISEEVEMRGPRGARKDSVVSMARQSHIEKIEKVGREGPIDKTELLVKVHTQPSFPTAVVIYCSSLRVRRCRSACLRPPPTLCGSV
jgi:hypothetical protein